MTRRLPRFVRFLLIPAVALSVGAAAYAGSGGFNPIDHHKMMLNHMASELALTDGQVAQIEGILEETRVDGEALHSEHEGLRDAGLNILTAEVIDSNAVESQRQQMLKLADRGSVLMAETFIDVANVLSYEQRLELADKLQSFHEEGGPEGHMKHMRPGMHH